MENCHVIVVIDEKAVVYDWDPNNYDSVFRNEGSWLIDKRYEDVEEAEEVARLINLLTRGNATEMYLMEQLIVKLK